MTVVTNKNTLIPYSEAKDKLIVQGLLNNLFPKGVINRVLLVNPPDGHSELFRVPTAQRGRYANYPPYGLLVLAENLRRSGIEVQVVNLNHELLKIYRSTKNAQEIDYDASWKKVLDESIKNFRPDLIGITCMFTMTHESFKRVCQHTALSKITLGIGGVHVTNDVARVLSDIPEANFAFTHEADVAFPRFCEILKEKSSLEGLCQLIVRNGSDLIHFANFYRPSGDELDIIPAYDLIDIENTSSVGTIGNFYGFKAPGTRFATALSNRGCRAQCTFCSVRNFNGSKVRQRSVESVLDELQLLHEKYGVGHITWLDDDLLKDHGRTMALWNGIVQRKIGITWDATNGVIAHSCNDEMVNAMADSGCIAVNIGMESGNPKILQEIQKPGLVKTFLRAAESFKKRPEIHVRAFLMLGFPGETLRMIGDTINVAREMDLDWYSITTLQPLPNTPIYDSMVEQGLIQDSSGIDVRFNSGGFGKQNEVDRGERLASKDFETAFCSIKLDEIPDQDQLQDIWFFMNYHLNFHRLFFETRPIKIEQQIKNLKTLSDLISPEHGFALYFLGYLQHTHEGKIAPETISRLKNKLDESKFWSDRFRAFGLSADDLVTGNFNNRKIMRLQPGKVPEDHLSISDVIGLS